MLKIFKRKMALLLTVVMMATMMLTVTGEEDLGAVAKAASQKTATISSIANLTKTLAVDEKVTMPSRVTAVMSDKTKKKVAVKWNKTLNSDVDGTYAAIGTVAGYSKKITFTLKVTAPKMGTIHIPTVTDSTIKTPTGIKLGIAKGTTWEDDQEKELDKTILSLFWTLESSEADQYDIQIYDQYKRNVANYGIGLNEEDFAKKQKDLALHLDKIKNLTITVITITPIKTTEEGRMTGDPTKNGIGETAVFECSVKVTTKTAKTVSMNATKPEDIINAYVLTFSDKVVPHTYFELSSEYRFINSDCYGTAHYGEFSRKDGAVIMNILDNELDKNAYLGSSSKLKLLIYSDAIVENDNKGAFTVTVHPVKYNK